MEKESRKEKGGFRLKKGLWNCNDKSNTWFRKQLCPSQMKKLTLDNIVQNFLTHTKATKKLNTVDRYESLYNNHIKQELADLRAMRVSPEIRNFVR